MTDAELIARIQEIIADEQALERYAAAHPDRRHNDTTVNEAFHFQNIVELFNRYRPRV